MPAGWPPRGAGPAFAIGTSKPKGAESGREIRVADTAIIGGQQGAVSVVLSSQGDENSMSFSVSFDTSKLTYVKTDRGVDLPGDAAIIKNETQAASGRVGMLVGLAADTAFPAGNRELVKLTFTAAATASPVATPVDMGVTPTPQSVSDMLGNDLTAAFTGGTVTINPPSGVGAWPLY
ncbi:MAG: hypothetical protein WCK47_06365 [bacterium]